MELLADKTVRRQDQFRNFMDKNDQNINKWNKVVPNNNNNNYNNTTTSTSNKEIAPE